MKKSITKALYLAIVCLVFAACGSSQPEEEYNGIKMSKQLAEKLYEYQENPELKESSRSCLEMREIGDMLALRYFYPDNIDATATAFMDENGKIAFILDDVNYTAVDTFYCGLAVVANKDKEFGIVNMKGEMVVPFGSYDFLIGYKNGYAYGFKEGKTYVINEKGEEINKFEFEDFIITNCGLLLPFNRHEKEISAALYNKKGEELISEGKVYDFRDSKDIEHVIIQLQDGSWSIFDSKGNNKPLDVDEVGNFEPRWGGLAQVKKNGKTGFINGSGELVIPCKYDSAEHVALQNGIMGFNGVKLIKDGKEGVYDDCGKEVWPIEYDAIHTCSKDLISCSKNGEQGVMNRKEKWLIHGNFVPIYDNLVPATSEEGVGLQTSEGKIVFSSEYKDNPVCDYYKDKNIVKLFCPGGKYMFLDTDTGKEIYYGTNDLVFHNNGLAEVEEYKANGEFKSGIIDKTGKYIVPVEDNQSASIVGNYIVVEYENGFEILNLKGKSIFKKSNSRIHNYYLFLDGFYFTTNASTYFVNAKEKVFYINGVLKLRDRKKRNPYYEFFVSN